MMDANRVFTNAYRCFLAVAAMCVAASARAADWPSWRGPQQNGFAAENAKVTQWQEDGENQLWKSPLGGRTTPILMNGRLYMIAPSGEGSCLGEQVVCLDAETGRTLWNHRFNVFLTDIVENRVGWTSVVGDPETGYVYAHGTGGEFFCLDGRDGRVVWKDSLGENYGRFSGYGGRLHTPIIDEDKVIVSIVYLLASWDSGPNKAAHRYLAYDKRTGKLIWSSMPGDKPLDTTYATPVVTVIGGRRLIIAPNADGNVYAILARTGERVWTFKLAKRGLNTAPVVDGKYVYVTHSEENLNTTEMGAVVCIDGSLTGDITDTGIVWRHDGITAGYSSPALANGRLYVVDNAAELYCYDAKTGKKYWEHRLGRVMKGSPIVTKDRVIYVGEVNGTFLILRDEGGKCVELDRKEFTRADKAVVEINGAPILSAGRLYFMTRYATYCLATKDKDRAPEPDPAPPLAAETEADPSKPATLLVVPAEVTLAPGDRTTFEVRAFDANGRLVDAPTASWSVTAVHGMVEKDGSFTAATDNVFSSGVVTAQAGKLKAAGRVRVSPRLPIHESFDKMKVGSLPPGWVGVDVKSVLAEFDGSVVLQKLAKSPSSPFMRMEAFSGPPLPAGYTVQADLYAVPKRGRRITLPDVGLINCRYQMTLLGQTDEIQLARWKDEPVHSFRLAKPYEMTPEKWYRAKLRVSVKAGKGMVQGKVWPRDEDEPADWTIEFEDHCPNVEGSPGLSGTSNGTTVTKEGAMAYYDNYQVYANE